MNRFQGVENERRKMSKLNNLAVHLLIDARDHIMKLPKDILEAKEIQDCLHFINVEVAYLGGVLSEYPIGGDYVLF